MRAEPCQCFNAVWGTASNAKHLIVRGGLPVVFAPLGDEEDRVRQGDDGAFVSAACIERPELVREGRTGKASTPCELNEEPAVSVGSLFEGAG